MPTADLIRAVAGRAIVPLADPLGAACDHWWPVYGITMIDRQAIFLAQAAHETDGFHTLQEYASGEAYEGREDLGNTQPGDGRRYKGRGIFMLTGRHNYRTTGERLKVNLEETPALASDPEISVLVACDYWKTRGLEALADKRDFYAITRRINGGLNGWDDRFKYWGRAWLALATDCKG